MTLRGQRILRAAVGVLSAIVVTGPVSAQEAATEKSVSVELKELYEADQADRTFATPPTAEQWQEITRRDKARRDRVMELVGAAALESGDDYFHAAMVFQHAEGSEDILVAHILATIAGFKGNEDAQWLSAAALDRYLHRIDRPQVLGTQYVRRSADEPWSQGAYDKKLPDAIRAAFGVPTLKEQEARVERMNARRPGGEQ